MKVTKIGNSIVIIKQGEIEQVIKKEATYNIGKSQKEYNIILEDKERKILICSNLSTAEADKEINKLYQVLSSTISLEEEYLRRNK